MPEQQQHEPVPHHCPNCATTLSAQVEQVPTFPTVAQYMSGVPAMEPQYRLWCAYGRCKAYQRAISASEYATLPAREQELLRTLIARTDRGG